MAEASVNRKLFFGFDEEDYTEEDLERDLKKTQTLPFAQIGTPSPYRPPARSRLSATLKASGDQEAISFSIKPMQLTKPTTVKPAPSNEPSEQVPEVLRTPSNEKKRKSSGEETANNVRVLFPPLELPTAPVQQQPIPVPVPSAQRSAVKVVPSRYMQAMTKAPSQENLNRAKNTASAKKPAAGPQPRRALSNVTTNVSNAADMDKRRQTMAVPPKKTAKVASAAPVKTSRPSVGPSASHTSTSLSFGTNSVTSTPSSHLSAESRAELLKRREQRLTGQPATKPQAPPKPARPSVGPYAMSSSSNGQKDQNHDNASSQEVPFKTPGTQSKAAALQRQQSVTFTSSTTGSATKTQANVRVVPSRYMNFKSEAPTRESTQRFSVDGNETETPHATPSRTPGHLKRSFSTSSLKKEQPTRKASDPTPSQAPVMPIQPAQSTQPKTLAARVAAVTSSSAQVNPAPASTLSSSSTIVPSTSATAVPKKTAVNPAQAIQQTQLLQTQLLQWHFINHRLEQAYQAKKIASMNMITSVWNKIVALQEAVEAASASLGEQQARVYQVELQQFKVACMTPLISNLHQFITDYSNTVHHLAQNTHKMPTIGLSMKSSHVAALLDALAAGKNALDRINQDFAPQIDRWQKVGVAVQSLAAIVRDESLDLKQYSEMLHALASLSTHEASLVIQQQQIQQENRHQNM